MADIDVDRTPREDSIRNGGNGSNGNNADTRNAEEEAIAEMERMMALQEQQHDEQDLIADNGREMDNAERLGHNGDNDEDVNANENPWNNDDRDGGNIDNAAVDQNETVEHAPKPMRIKAPYATISTIIAFIHIVYILRTRKQVYLALLYLTSSKASYIIVGNMALSLLVSCFYVTVQTFLNGLRLMESETIMDNIRWNVTETCFAFTMFRSELTVGTIGLFCSLILGKCLHWAVELRGAHLRMTEDVFYFQDDDNPTEDTPSRNQSKHRLWGRFQRHLSFSPNVPRVRLSHWKYYALMNILYLCDIGALGYFASSLLEDGPSVHILFSFEVAILLISIMSSHALYLIHVLDGIISILQRLFQTKTPEANESTSNENGSDGNERTEEREVHDTDSDLSARSQPTVSPFARTVHRITSFWRDHHVTANFSVELMTLAAKFLFHLVLFVVVMTIYGLPINIIREVYMSYQRLRSRLSAFASYRRLTSNMNTRFEIVTSQEELEQAGPTCIICRDRMELEGVHGDCVKLPICGHIFHKHCLREWLVQQQTCPTCRADITANEAKAKVLTAAAERADEERKEQEMKQAETKSDAIKDDGGRQDENANHEKNKTKSCNFPTPRLYKVTECTGAQVVVFTPGDNEVDCMDTKRVISAGTLVIVMGIVFKSWCSKESSNCLGPKHFLKTQDGWINEEDVERLIELSTKAQN